MRHNNLQKNDLISRYIQWQSFPVEDWEKLDLAIRFTAFLPPPIRFTAMI